MDDSIIKLDQEIRKFLDSRALYKIHNRIEYPRVRFSNTEKFSYTFIIDNLIKLTEFKHQISIWEDYKKDTIKYHHFLYDRIYEIIFKHMMKYNIKNFIINFETNKMIPTGYIHLEMIGIKLIANHVLSYKQII